MTTAILSVSYSQICVFASALDVPFNDWTKEHVAQGFAWRQGSVSFSTIEEGGEHSITVVVADHLGPVSDDAVRVIEVPFDAPADGSVEIASISDSFLVTLPAGRCLLRCEFFEGREDVPAVRLGFGTSDEADFRIVVADPELTPAFPLLTSAVPAL